MSDGVLTEHAFTVLVNTSDGFEDCWRPFFTLLERYWPGHPTPVLLNTERCEWGGAQTRVRCACVQHADEPRQSWSVCLERALAMVQTPLVLYLQEDYFIERTVNDQQLADLAALMLAEPAIRHIGLTAFGSAGPFSRSRWPGLWQIGPRAKYRISTQAGLWRVDALRSYLRAYENGWMFEIYGTRRSWRRPELFLTVDRDQYAGETAPIPYSHAGIIKGRWHRSVPRLFAEHGITVDFDRRGYFVPKPRWLERIVTARRLLRRPDALLTGLRGL